MTELLYKQGKWEIVEFSFGGYKLPLYSIYHRCQKDFTTECYGTGWVRRYNPRGCSCNVKVPDNIMAIYSALML